MANLIPQGGVFAGLDRLNQALDQRAQNAMALSQMRENQRRNALIEGIAAEDRAKEKQMYDMKLNAMTQNQGAENFMYQNLPFLQGQPDIYGEQSGVLMQDIARQFPNANIGEIQQGLAGMQPKKEKVKFSPYGYGQVIDEEGNIFKVPTPPVGGGHGGSPDPFFTPVQTANGVVAFDNRTGKGAPLDIGGNPVIGAVADPALQEALARAKASGKVSGESTTQAKIDLPQHVQEAEDTIGLIDQMLSHPGMKQAVGKSAIFGVQKIPGTDAKSFMVALDQLKGKQFLQAFQSLKGGGQITEIEGQKATQAISRMDNANTEKEFIAASREFQGIIRKGVERAKQKAGVQANIQKLSDADLLKALGVK